MNRAKLIGICAVGALSITGGIVTLMPSRDEPRLDPKRAHEAKASAAPAAESGFASTLAGLVLAVRGLGERLGALEARQARADELPPGAASAAEPASDEAPEQQIERQKTEYLRRFETVNRSFADEERDDAWAGNREAELGKAFSSGKYEGTRLLSAACKSSFCRMEAEHDTTDNGVAFERIRHDVSGNFYLQHFDATDSSKARTVVFFVRDGQRERNPLYDMMYVHE
jgi:hypothetical protein